MRSRLGLALVAGAASAARAFAQGEHERRLAAELTIVAGDVRRLEAAGESPPRIEGLRARIAGALSSLPLLLRQAGADPAPVPALRTALARQDWRALRARLEELRARHPFDATPWAFAAPTPERLRAGAAIHRQTCAGCHDAPPGDAKLPALELRAMARAMPREEFAARLLVGVRGDRSTAYRNPFSDLELSALVAWYTSGGTAASK